MRIVIALGGNALLRRGECADAATQLRNVQAAVRAVAPLLCGNEVVVTHGNGPQIGMLALQGAQASGNAPASLDVLGAQTEGMIGYLLEREFMNTLGNARTVTILTQVEVDAADPAFAHPTKFIGPQYENAEARDIVAKHGWTMALDGDRLRRVVASPEPMHILQSEPIDQLLSAGFLVVCAGGGGIPVARHANSRLAGVDAVIDKDLTSALLAEKLRADCLVMLTDAPAVFLDWQTPAQRQIRAAHPAALRRIAFARGSMGPKVEAACRFASIQHGRAFIGDLESASGLLACTAGTLVSDSMQGIDTWR